MTVSDPKINKGLNIKRGKETLLILKKPKQKQNKFLGLYPANG